MINITLPLLEKIVWHEQGNKNEVKQLLAPTTKIDCKVILSSRSYIVIEDSNKETYCLTCNKDSFAPKQSFVLLTDKKPSEERLRNNDLKIKCWLKHPLDKEHTLSKVIQSWHNNFNFIEETEKMNGLREPQIAALFSILGHLKVADETGIIVMPTGTGKTETMLSTLAANQCSKVLITVPSDALRTQIANKFYTFGLLKQFNIINNQALYPKVGIIRNSFKTIEELEDFFNKANVIITTMNIVADSSLEFQNRISELCSHLFIDEAHHTPAKSWDNFRLRFKNNKVLQFTATPFRNDRKRLDGKIIFNFPLKKAQDQGYFKKINFIPIREYDFDKADKLIADKAVEKLRSDRLNGYDHILFARCENKVRAEEIFKYYKVHNDLNPTLIYSNIPDKSNILKNIIRKKHKIIVAVNMLGEGFDLPQLKIAAFHDIRKSLPVTLQFAGRFTRTSRDNELGEASFIANLADIKVEEELSELYAQDANWNLLLSNLSSSEIDEEINFKDFMDGFQNLDQSKIPFQNIRMPLSTVVYKNLSNEWYPTNYKKGISNIEDLDYEFSDINRSNKTIVIITARKKPVDWGNFKDIYELDWALTIIYWDSKTNLLFIHSSDKTGLYENLANAVLNEKAQLINQLDVFKAFYAINRVSLQNVGLKEFLGRQIRFRMSVGTDVQEALSLAEKSRGQKAFVFGTGYEDGNKISLGCSYKGRIWSYLRGDIRDFIAWSNKIGQKLINENIDPNQILKDTLMPEVVKERPKLFPITIDWDEIIYNNSEHNVLISTDNKNYALTVCSLQIVNPSENGPLEFCIKTPDGDIILEKKIIEKLEEGGSYPDVEIIKLSKKTANIIIGTKTHKIEDFFTTYIPTIWFVDGSALTGIYYTQLKQQIIPYPIDQLISWDWTNVSIQKEAQRVDPKITDSIQYNVIRRLEKEDFDLIYDDDGSGEIADIVAIKENKNDMKINLYHLKYASNGEVNNDIQNFYEVCGQAQKSIHWKHKKGYELFEHLLRREPKKRSGKECSRIEKGSYADLERFSLLARHQKPIEFEIYIVQPSLSKLKPSIDILTLLGVTQNYLKEVGNIDLNVIVSE